MNLIVLSDDAFRREGCASFLSGAFDECYVHKLKSPEQLWTHHSKVDLILFDTMIGEGGLWKEIIVDIHDKKENTPICLISSFDSNEKIKTAFEIGVKGYLPIGISLREAREVVHHIVSGKTVIPDALLKPKQVKTHPLLTPKQVEIMFFLEKGYSNKRIADSLGLSIGTIKRHVSNIFTNLGTNNRIEAVYVYKKTM